MSDAAAAQEGRHSTHACCAISFRQRAQRSMSSELLACASNHCMQQSHAHAQQRNCRSCNLRAGAIMGSKTKHN